MNILVLFDLLETPQDQNYVEDLLSPEWKAEAAVVGALRALGHRVRLFGVCDDVGPLLDELKRDRPDLVFNLFEAFGGDRSKEANIPALLELLGIRYTGCAPAALNLCKDKARAKKLVAFHGVRVPRFVVSRREAPLKSLGDLPYPVIVKPLGLEASVGIAHGAVTKDEARALERIRLVHYRYEQDVIVEEFIAGREVYLGVLGGAGGLEVFPPRELLFEDMPAGSPRIATFAAKWDVAYRKRWGIRSAPARGLTRVAREALEDAARRVAAALELTGYTRLDLRLTPEGVPVFLEANPNPSMARDDEFAESAAQGGTSYRRLITRVISHAMAAP